MEPKQQSAAVMKTVGLVFAVFPFFTGVLDWLVAMCWLNAWVEMRTRISRYHPSSDKVELAFTALGVTVFCLFLHLFCFLMPRFLGSFNIAMSRTAWQVLFIGCELAGLGCCALIYFQK